MSVEFEMEQISRGKAECNYPFPIQQEWYLSQIFTAIPMLFHVNALLTDFCWCFHVRDVQIALLKHMSH